jgi:hypothetical protein
MSSESDKSRARRHINGACCCDALRRTCALCSLAGEFAAVREPLEGLLREAVVLIDFDANLVARIDAVLGEEEKEESRG